jgi:hypothetical protein
LGYLDYFFLIPNKSQKFSFVNSVHNDL